MNDPKPGIYTTEFWATMIGKVMIFAVSVGVITQDKANELTSHLCTAAAGVFAVIALWRLAVCYIQSRTSLKTTAVSTAALLSKAASVSVLPVAVIGIILVFTSASPAQIFGGWRYTLLDHERRIGFLEGKASVPPAPANPAPIILPAPSQPATTAPQPIIITPPAAPAFPAVAPQPASPPVVLIVPGTSSQPVSPVGVNPQPVSPVGVNPQPVSPVGTNPQPVSPVGQNSQPVSPIGTNPQPIGPTGINPAAALPGGGNPPGTVSVPASPGTVKPQGVPPASPLPGGGNPPATNPQTINPSSSGYRAYRYPNGTILYYWTR